MRDRTPGIYSQETHYPDSCSWDVQDLYLNSDGTLFKRVRRNQEAGYSCTNPMICYSDITRCTLKSPDFYDDCLASGTEASAGGAAGAASDESWTPPEECFPYYTDCELAEPTCPGE